MNTLWMRVTEIYHEWPSHILLEWVNTCHSSAWQIRYMRQQIWLFMSQIFNIYVCIWLCVYMPVVYKYEPMCDIPVSYSLTTVLHSSWISYGFIYFCFECANSSTIFIGFLSLQPSRINCKIGLPPCLCGYIHASIDGERKHMHIKYMWGIW